jgi:hypothetical protein
MLDNFRFKIKIPLIYIMSAKGTYRNISTISNVITKDTTNIYTSETENENWGAIPTNTPILAQGCGSFSESFFGFYVGSGTITRLSMNAYPVESNSTFTIRIKAIDKDYNEHEYPNTLTFTGRMDTKVVSLPLPYEDNQIVVSFVSATNYPSGLARLRFYVSVTE